MLERLSRWDHLLAEGRVPAPPDGGGAAWRLGGQARFGIVGSRTCLQGPCCFSGEATLSDAGKLALGGPRRGFRAALRQTDQGARNDRDEQRQLTRLVAAEPKGPALAATARSVRGAPWGRSLTRGATPSRVGGPRAAARLLRKWTGSVLSTPCAFLPVGCCTCGG